MTSLLDSTPLWQRTLANQSDGLDGPREFLRQSFLSFRNRVAGLVSTIGSELPNLTVHDITHIDSLWRVAGVIAGTNYLVNPAEAYVLGGAFLLHDAAHVLAAYPGRLDEIKKSLQWQDYVAQRYRGVEPIIGSPSEKFLIFQVLRHLHAEQAYRLAHASWKIDDATGPIHLIENIELRQYFGDVIGTVAASHHWPPAKVASEFADRRLACPAFLAPATWEVDVLKVALLLRTADAAHLDADRAPWFLFALKNPEGISRDHWRFQAKLGQPSLTATGELRLSSGSSFGVSERSAWWLAFEAAQMVDRELRSAHEILQDEGRELFAAQRVAGSDTASSFQKQIPVSGWYPIDVAPSIGNIPALISKLGGSALYGDNIAAPLRELLQNGIDAMLALQSLSNLGTSTDAIHVGVRAASPGEWWLEVTDCGIGMSRHVLTSVLLDFGSSLWSSDTLRDELPGLAKSGFRSIGKFGIGFFSVFMLGNEVRVTTRRYDQAVNGESLHWQLRFEEGLGARPVMLRPDQSETLTRSGTRISVRLSEKTLSEMLESIVVRSPFDGIFDGILPSPPTDFDRRDQLLALLVARICPTGAVNITSQLNSAPRRLAVAANDWIKLDAESLLARVGVRGDNLFPLEDSQKRLIGRLKLGENSFDSRPAVIVYQGIACGKLSGLEGVVFARDNNQDARRVEAFPAGSISDWRDWANKVLASPHPLASDHRLRLHPLVPEADLRVWIAGDEVMELADLMRHIAKADSVVLHRGSIDHEDTDDVSNERFDRSFIPAPNVICYPHFEMASANWYFRVVLLLPMIGTLFHGASASSQSTIWIDSNRRFR